MRSCLLSGSLVGHFTHLFLGDHTHYPTTVPTVLNFLLLHRSISTLSCSPFSPPSYHPPLFLSSLSITQYQSRVVSGNCVFPGILRYRGVPIDRLPLDLCPQGLLSLRSSQIAEDSPPHVNPLHSHQSQLATYTCHSLSHSFSTSTVGRLQGLGRTCLWAHAPQTCAVWWFGRP